MPAAILDQEQIWALADGYARPTGVTVSSLESDSTGLATTFPAGLTSASAQNTPVGSPTGVSIGVSAVSAEADPIGIAIGVPSGVIVASSRATLIGTPVSLPSGLSSASAENNPIGVPAGVTAGLSIASAQASPSGNPSSLPSGISAASSLGSAVPIVTNLPSGVSSSTAESTSIGVGIGIPSGTAASVSQGSVLGNSTSLPSGQQVTSSEGSSVGSGAANVVVSGVSSASSENNALGVVFGIASSQTSASSETNPLGAVSASVGGQSVASSLGSVSILIFVLPSAQTLVVSVSSGVTTTADARASPSGQTATVTENDPTATNGSIFNSVSCTSSIGNGFVVVVTLVSGINVISAVSSPDGLPAGVTTGVSCSSSENNPIATIEAVANPGGQTATSSANLLSTSVYCISASVSAFSQAGNSSASSSGVGLVVGVAAVGIENDPTAGLDATTLLDQVLAVFSVQTVVGIFVPAPVKAVAIRGDSAGSSGSFFQEYTSNTVSASVSLTVDKFWGE